MASADIAAVAQPQSRLEDVRMVVLARSVKDGQCCVAGKRIVSPGESGAQRWHLGEWIRPVTRLQGTGDAVPGEAFRLGPLSKVCVRLNTQGDVAEQPENRLWSESHPVRLLGMANRERLAAMPGLLDQPDTLWHDPHAGGINRVREHFPADASLNLIRVQKLVIYRQRNAMGNDRLYARFVYNGVAYSGLSVTDPQVWSYVESLRRGDTFTGETRLPGGDDYWITVSLTKPYGPGRYRYKVAAAFL